MSKLSTTYWVAGNTKGSSVQHMQSLKKRVERITVPIVVEIGETVVTVQELLDLRLGDVLHLDTKIEEAMQIVIGSHKKFLCKPGVLGSKLAVQITSVVEEGEGTYE